MFSAALSSGQAGGRGTSVRLLGGVSSRVVIDEAVLLPHAHLVLEPHLDRRSRRKLLHGRGDDDGEVFLNAAIAWGSWAGCRGRALMCEKPRSLRIRHSR